MKTNEKCTKCNSNDIVKIPGSAGAYGSGSNIMTGMTTLSAVKVTRYLCCNCGFTEEWIDNKKDIEKIRAKYLS